MGGGASLHTVKQRKRLFGFNMDTSHAVNFRILEGGIIPLQPGPYAPDSWLKVNHLESCIIHLREKNSPHFFKVIRVTLHITSPNTLGLQGNGVLPKCRIRFMIFNATFNNISVISWGSVLLVP